MHDVDLPPRDGADKLLSKPGIGEDEFHDNEAGHHRGGIERHRSEARDDGGRQGMQENDPPFGHPGEAESLDEVSRQGLDHADAQDTGQIGN